jgi:hypothetical protein
MTLQRWTVRLVYSAIGIVVSLISVAFLAVQMQQRVLRWRATRLLAEMHQIRLYESTWTDAQHLMHRWGAWGHYEGSCTAASCTYEITMASSAFYNPLVPRHAWLDWLFRHDRLNLYSWLGGHGSTFTSSFTVHNGTIWREGSSIGVVVSRRKMRRENDSDLTLSMGAASYQRLHRTLKDWAVFMGGADGLVGHPYYKVGRPGGCMINCEIGVIYFSTHTPPAEIERLTSYDLSCMTRFNPCGRLEDLLPAADEWHLYPDHELSDNELQVQYQKDKESEEKPCSVPVWALARDARYVLAVQALSTSTEKIGGEQDWYQEAAQVRVVASLKEPVPWPLGAVVTTHPNGAYRFQPSINPEHLVPGKRYLVFPLGNDQRDRLLTKDSPITLERCGVQEDTPETRRELEFGFAQNDTLNP